MSKWQPIETAPKDGTYILISNNVVFTRGYWAFYEEPETVSLGYGVDVHEGGWPKNPFQAWSTEQVPNPKAGNRKYYWFLDNPVAYKNEDIACPDDDGCFDSFQPTHWMPLPTPPEAP